MSSKTDRSPTGFKWAFTRHPDQVSKMTLLGYVLLSNHGLGPFWYEVYGDKDGNLFFDSDWGLEPYSLEVHGNIYTKEGVEEFESRHS